VGREYLIGEKKAALLREGCAVVLLSKDEKRRAEGTLVRLEPTGKARNGVQRYNVHMKDLKEVPYKAENLDRWGVNVVP
jgi:hypothetical protein